MAVKVKGPIIVIKEAEEDPDLSYLTQDYAEIKDEKERQLYLEQDRRRLERFGWDWDMWTMHAEVNVEVTHKGQKSHQVVYSSYLGGIESDSDQAYVKSIERGMVMEVKNAIKGMSGRKKICTKDVLIEVEEKQWR